MIASPCDDGGRDCRIGFVIVGGSNPDIELLKNPQQVSISTLVILEEG